MQGSGGEPGDWFFAFACNEMDEMMSVVMTVMIGIIAVGVFVRWKCMVGAVVMPVRCEMWVV